MSKKHKGGKHTAKAHFPHGIGDVKHDGMAHGTHHEMNSKHGTGKGFAAGDEYHGGDSEGSKGAPGMGANCASED